MAEGAESGGWAAPGAKVAMAPMAQMEPLAGWQAAREATEAMARLAVWVAKEELAARRRPMDLSLA